MRGCEKWIPDKILHRYDDPKNFSTFFFHRKKKHFENEKIFSKKIEFFSKEKLENFHFALKKISMQKSIFQNFPLKNSRKFSKIFFHFQNDFFIDEKKS